MTFQFERLHGKHTIHEVLLDPRKTTFLNGFLEAQKNRNLPSSPWWTKGTSKLLPLYLEAYELIEKLKRYPRANYSERNNEWPRLRHRILSANLEGIDVNISLEDALSVLSTKFENGIMMDFRLSVWWARMVAYLDCSPPFFAIPYCMFLYDKVLQDVFMMHLLSRGHQFWLKAWAVIEEKVCPMLRCLQAAAEKISRENGEEEEENTGGFDTLTECEGIRSVALGLWDCFLAPGAPCELFGLRDLDPDICLLRSMLADHQHTVRNYALKEATICPANELQDIILIGETCCLAHRHIELHLAQSDWVPFRLSSLYERMCCTILDEAQRLGLEKEWESGGTVPFHTFDEVWPSVDHGMLLHNLTRSCKLPEGVSMHQLPVRSTSSISGPPRKHKFYHSSSSHARCVNESRDAPRNSKPELTTPFMDDPSSFTTTVDWLVQFESNVHEETIGIQRSQCIPVSDLAVSLHARKGNIPVNLDPFLCPDLPEQGGGHQQHHSFMRASGAKTQPPPPELFSFIAPSQRADGAGLLGVCLLVYKRNFGATSLVDISPPLLAVSIPGEESTERESVAAGCSQSCSFSNSPVSLPMSPNVHKNGEGKDAESNSDDSATVELLVRTTERKPEYLPCGICILTECEPFSRQEDAHHRLYQTATLRQGLYNYFQEFKESIMKEEGNDVKTMSQNSSIVHPWSEMNSESLCQEILPFVKNCETVPLASAHDFLCIVRTMSPRHVCTIMTALLSEQKVVLVSKSKALLPIACDVLLGLLHPLSWLHVYVPLVPRQMASVLPQCPVPFLLGVPSNYLAGESSSMKIPDDVLVLDIDTGRISGSFTPTTKHQQQPYQLDDIHEELIKLLVPEVENFHCLLGSYNTTMQSGERNLHSVDVEKLVLSIQLLFSNAISKLLTGVSECCVTLGTDTFESIRLFHESAFASVKQSQGYRDLHSTNGLIQLFTKSQMLSAHICSI